MNSNLKNTHPTDEYYTPIQLKLPLDLETLISFVNWKSKFRYE